MTIGGLLGAMLMILSATMVNVAVPSIMGAYGVGQDLAQWASTAFLATMVASQLLNAWMVAAFGQRFTFSMTLVVFTIGSLICAVSPTIEVLIIGRIMQGFSAGVIQPLVMATIISVFPADRRGFAMGLYGMGVTLAPSFGPLAGGRQAQAFRPDQDFHRRPVFQMFRPKNAKDGGHVTVPDHPLKAVDGAEKGGESKPVRALIIPVRKSAKKPAAKSNKRSEKIKK